MSFVLGLALAGAQLGPGFADLAAIDRQVATFTGAGVGMPGGAVLPVDRRLRLRSCANPLAVGWNGVRRDSVQVSCPDAGGWRIFVPVAAVQAASVAAAAPAVNRGDAVTIAVQGDGFSVSQPGEALESGPMGSWIRVRPVRANRVTASTNGETLRAQIVRPGMVAIPLP